jgi:hypothetical protein
MADDELVDEVPRRTEAEALRTELRELLTSTRVTVLLLVTAGLVVLYAAASTRSIAGSPPFVPQGVDARGLLFIMSTALVTGTIGAFLLGTLAFPRTPPASGPLLRFGATAVANALAALVYGVVAIGLSAVTYLVVSAIEGSEPSDLFDPAVVSIALAALAAYPLWALIGVGVGAIAGSDVVAVAAALLWPPVERGLLTLFNSNDANASMGYLPLSATTVMLAPPEGPTVFLPETMTRPGAAMVLVVYSLVFLGLGALVVSRRSRPASADESLAPDPDVDPSAD